MPPRPTMFVRALRRRCPICGGGPLFRRWLQMMPACPQCGFLTNRSESGYGLGAIWFNMIASEAVNMSFWITVSVRTWPNVPWDLLGRIGPITAVLMPLFFFPFSRTMFLAFDLSLRPASRDEQSTIANFHGGKGCQS